ncbi:MAG: biotin transporter BioY [Ignisphaera sp.]|nr:biotin transporter BioY [Ignisphaera sp.]MDW8084857.1 biotin transporter BioY [Ignisphaera sp.]
MLSIGVSILTGLLAQLHLYLGPIPYTMQCMGVVLAGLLLPPKYSLLSTTIYLVFISLGLPLAAGFRGGLAVLLGPTGGYLLGFPISALLMSFSTRLYLRLRKMSLADIKSVDTAVLLCFSFLALLPMYILGFAVFTYYALGDQRLMQWVTTSTSIIGLDTSDPLMKLFIATVAVFIPQDIFMDSLLAIVVSRYAARLLRFRGVVV